MTVLIKVYLVILLFGFLLRILFNGCCVNLILYSFESVKYGYIGNCNLKEEFEKNGEDTLYIRNDDKYVDYEIINTNSYINNYLN